MSETTAVTTQLCPCNVLHQVPMAWLVTDRELNILDGNELFWKEVAFRDAPVRGTPLELALPEELANPIRTAAREAMRTGRPSEATRLRILPPGQPYRVIDVTVSPAAVRDQDVLLIASSTIGDGGRRVEELTLLHDMIRVLREQTDIDRVLFTTLTCATAGSGGLGFNRAWVFLSDDTGEWLVGVMALGPASREEANRIWSELSSSPRTLDQFAAAYDRWVASGPHALQEQIKNVRFSLREDRSQLPVLAMVENRPFHVFSAETDIRVHPRLADLLNVSEFVIAPMVVGGVARGVVLADNLYSEAPITQGHTRLLSLFAQHAGMALEDAQLHRRMEEHQRELEQAYADLKEAQDEVLRTAKLAALGEMAARIAHDIRNPLVTLGGWARVVQEDPEDTETVVTAAKIIAEESANLEGMLAMLLEPFAARNLRLEPTDLNQLIEDTLQTQEPKVQQQGITIHRDYAADLPPIPADPGQLRRCLTNLIENAIQAMPRGGALSVLTRRNDDEIVVEIGDTGIGITEDQLPHIFDAFYSTGHFGSGLGLAIVWDIVQSHGFTIDVRSEPGRGSVFAIHVPFSNGEIAATRSAG